MTETTEQLKSEISDQYLKDFKDELWWMKSLVLLPIEKKVKKILTWEFQLPEKFDAVQEFGWRKDIINFVSPKVANQIFDFMKEKRLEIEKRKTEDELRKLKAEILWESIQETTMTGAASTPDMQPQNASDVVQIPASSDAESHETSSSNVNPVAAGAATAVGGVALTKGIATKLNARELSQMAEKFDGKQAKELLNNAVDALEKQKQVMGRRLSTKQIRSIDKHISKLKEGMASADDEVVQLLKAWQKLDTKLPKKLLAECGLSASQLTKIDNLASQLVGKDSQAIKAVLDQNGLSKVSDDVISALSKASTEAELKSMTRILKHGTKINRFVQTFAGAMLIDVACFWFDVWMYLETQKEADLIAKVNEVRAQNKRNQANTQLWIGAGSVIAEAAIILTAMSTGTAVGWPFGTIAGLAVGGLSAAASMGVDALYFDVQDFYKQNKEDFLRQKSSQLNQAILQGIYNKKEGDKSLNEKRGSPEPAQKAESLRDACWSMFFLDELQDGAFASYSPFWEYVQSGEKRADFVNRLPSDQASEFRKKRDEIAWKITKRMEYLSQEFEKPDVIQKIKNGQGMNYISKLFTQSKAYVEMQAQSQWDKTLDFDKNLAKYKSAFFTDFPKEKLEKIEKLRQEQPYLFQELMATASLSSLLKETQTDLNYDQNVKLVARYQEWLDLTALQSEKNGLIIPDSAKNMRFIEKFLEADFDLNKVSFLGNSEEQVKELVHLRQERRAIMEISDDPMQNVLYRLAKELYGYTGENEKGALMAFYDEGNGWVHGIYYKDARKVNDDWFWDVKMDEVKDPLTFKSQQEVEQFAINFIKNNLKYHYMQSVVDTPTEAIDPSLQLELEGKLKTLLVEELSSRIESNQQKVKNQISTFVKKQAKNGEYVELPYYLLLEARRAGLGDLQRQFYTRKEGKMEVILLPSELNDTYFLDAKKTYLTSAREKFSSEEQVYIERVERAHKQLETLRSVSGDTLLGKGKSFADELDLPKEVEILISDKYKQWQKFKSNLLMYDADSACSSDVLAAYEDFALYFENLYRGILLQLSTFSMSNDIDTYSYYSQANRYGELSYFDEKGNLKPDLSLGFLKKEKLRAFYAEQFKIQRLAWKTLQQLRASKNESEKKLAQQASAMILTCIVEQSFLTKDTGGKITHISVGGNCLDSDQNDGYEDYKAKTQELITQRLGQMKLMPPLDSKKIASLQKKEQKILALTPNDEKITVQMSAVQKQIEAQMSEVVWQGKRWNLMYDPEKSTISSRKNQTKVEIKNNKLYLQGLDLVLTASELAWLANFRNWIRHEYFGRTVAFEIEGVHDALVVKWKTQYADDIELISQDTFARYCPIGKDDAVMKRISVWLNSGLK